MDPTTVVKTADIPAIVFDRIANCSPRHAYFDADEVAHWPAWVLQALLGARLFQETNRATEVFCDGCEWGCLKPVVVRTSSGGRKTHAYVVCDAEPDRGRIGVAPERLRRYIATVGFAAKLLGRSLKLRTSTRPVHGSAAIVGQVEGRNGRRVLSVDVRQGQLLLAAGGHCTPLGELVHWDRKALALDARAIRRLIDKKASRIRSDDLPPAEHPKRDRRTTARRDQRIRQQAARLLRQNKTWTVSRIAKHIARTDLARGISDARVRRIIYEKNS